MVILVGLAIDQIAQSGLSSLSVIYYSAQLFRLWQYWSLFRSANPGNAKCNGRSVCSVRPQQ
ncbi:hypothetical protein C6669_19695 [Escherichia coli]|nr:hypothetical protein C6669_19695 [Escherichia coli]